MVADLYAKINGTWVPLKDSWIKVGGEWIKLSFQNQGGTAGSDYITISAPTGTSDVPTYTTSSTFRIYGTLSGSISAIYVNNSPATIDGSIWYRDVSFTQDQILPVNIYSVDDSGAPSDVTTVYLCYDVNNPILTVSTPASGNSSAPTLTKSATYAVTGTASDVSGLRSLTVNDVAISADANNNYSTDITLSKNTTTAVQVVATDKSAGRQTTITKYVRYNDTETQQTMAGVYTGHNNSWSAKATNEATVYDSVEGTTWSDNNHQVCIVAKTACSPSSITFKTPVIVNSGQASTITYSIYGSNSTFSTTIDKMSWDTLVSNANWYQSFQGGTTQTLPIPFNGKTYKYIRMVTTWFYGANDYHGVHYGSLSIKGY